MNNSQKPAATPITIDAEAYEIKPTPAQALPEGIYALTSLLVGGAVEAADIAIARVQKWQAEYHAQPALLSPPYNETRADRLRYILIGLIFESEEFIRSRTGWLGNLALNAASKADQLARPVTGSWLMAPFVRPLRSLSRQAQTDLERLLHRGRMEETVSRIMTKELADEAVERVLEYLSDKPELRQLIQEQGTSLAGEIVDTARGRAVNADAKVERVMRSLLDRGPRQPSSPIANRPESSK